MAAHVFDKAPMPPILGQALDYQTYGTDVSKLNPGVFAGLRSVNNSYRALMGYKNAAGHTVEWSRQNPDAWEFVGKVLKMRKENKERTHATRS